MGKQERERERRREERLQGQADDEAAARRRRATRLIAGVGFAAIVVVAILILASQSSDSGSDGDGGDVEGAAEVRALLSGIPQRGTVLGDPGAARKIVEFGDLQCPICREFSTGVIEDLIGRVVSEGTAKLEFRNWTILGPQSQVAARASLAASLQGRYWQFVELFYRNQGAENSGYVTDEFLRSIAEGAGVADLERWESDRELPRWNEALTATDDRALALGFTGTPSILVSGPGGEIALGTPGSAAEIENGLSGVGGG